MKKVCAWCQKSLGFTSDTTDAVTHGICPECCAKFFEAADADTLKEFLESFDFPIMVVNDDAVAVSANDKALRALGRKLDETIGFRGGDIVECAHSKLPGGCGRTEHCLACTLRKSVSETHKTGLSLQDVPVTIKALKSGYMHTIRMKITTEKINGLVMLKIVEIESD